MYCQMKQVTICISDEKELHYGILIDKNFFLQTAREKLRQSA